MNDGEQRSGSNTAETSSAAKIESWPPGLCGANSHQTLLLSAADLRTPAFRPKKATVPLKTTLVH